MSNVAQWLKSCLCTQAQLASAPFQAWCDQLREPRNHFHRKVWEWCYVAQALHERGFLQPGMRGLGFAVGQEPLSALFASLGCSILATDQAASAAEQGGWVTTGQHAAHLEQLNLRGICDPAVFAERVRFRAVDMRAIPQDLGEFDFLWSCCALEHLGTMKLGEDFLFAALDRLRPGGVAVHTTEFNVSSNWLTRWSGQEVLFRRRDIERIARALRRQGHQIELDFTPGDLPIDKLIDRPPYRPTNHLKLRNGWFVTTSIGLIIQKAA